MENKIKENKYTVERIGGWILIGAIVIGCGFVLLPFILDILWAAILCFVTWPLYELLMKWLRKRRTLVAFLMTILLLLVLFIPFFIIGMKFTTSISGAIEWLDLHQKIGFPEAPMWLDRIPLIGSKLSQYWTAFAHRDENILNKFFPAIRISGLWLIKHSVVVGQGILHLAFSVFITFFLYRDGQTISAGINKILNQISGKRSQHFITVVKTTVQNVVYGAIGTALVQAILAGIGFSIAGVPSVMLLALFTFFLSFVPFGPPIVWIAAALWLFAEKHTGCGIFMLIYGAIVISSIDNFIKPYFISRGTNLPFIVTFIGVLGGIATFGLIGVFLGPTLLAVGYSLLREVLDHRGEVSS